MKRNVTMTRHSGKSGERLGLVLAVYLVGLLVGGLYVGMISPARTVIQADFGIDGTLGIWMINIYTLFYAALIPIIGKVADRRGRSRVFAICVGIFCAGSVFCVLPASEPVADPGKMDVAGSVLFALFVLLLLLGVKDIDFTAFAESAARPATWGPLLGAVAAIAVFRSVEQRAEDPVFHLEYFHSRPIVITMTVSFFIGCFVMSLVLVPELAEYAMGDPLGSGGYYVMAIGLTSFVTTPVGGKIIDKVGPKPVLVTGLAISIVGLLFLALVAVVAPSVATFVVGLMVVGAGMGMAMGAPTNYMILENTSKEDSTSAIATITLIRQIGASIAPAIFVGLIASAPGLAGYQNMLLCVAIFNACALVTMLFYRSSGK